MSREYECRCNLCGAQWFYNDQDIREIQDKVKQAKGHMAVGVVGALAGSGINPIYQGNAAAQAVGTVTDLTRCQKCGSSDVNIVYEEVYNFFLDDPASPLRGKLSSLPSANSAAVSGSKSKIVAGLLAIFLGSLGIHKFYLGYTKQGVIMLLVSLVGGIFTVGLSALVMMLIGLIEGIIYLCKSPQAFDETYVTSFKGWF